MLPKKNRADTNEIDKIFKEGSFIVSSNLTFKYIRNSSKGVRVSFIAPKSVARLAVERNSLRRLGYNILKNYINQFPTGIVGAFVFKRYQDDALIIENEIKTILSKIN